MASMFHVKDSCITLLATGDAFHIVAQQLAMPYIYPIDAAARVPRQQSQDLRVSRVLELRVASDTDLG